MKKTNWDLQKMGLIPLSEQEKLHFNGGSTLPIFFTKAIVSIANGIITSFQTLKFM